MMNTLRSEWTKLRSTKAFWWTTFLFVAISLGFAALMGLFAEESEFGIPMLLPATTVAGLTGIGLMVIIIQAVMVVTSEYRHNVQSATFMATPNRVVVAVSKALLYGVISAVITVLTVLGSYYVAKATASDFASSTLDVFNNSDAIRYMWALPAASAMLTLFTHGISWLLRQTAGAIALMLIWFTALEGLASFLPKVGKYISQYGPMTNLLSFAQDNAIKDGPWGVAGSGWYFLVWAVVVFIVGVLVLSRRDA